MTSKLLNFSKNSHRESNLFQPLNLNLDIFDPKLYNYCQDISQTKFKRTFSARRVHTISSKSEDSAPITKSRRPSTGRRQQDTRQLQITTRPKTATNRFYAGIDLVKSNVKENIFNQLEISIKQQIFSQITKQERKQIISEFALLLEIFSKNTTFQDIFAKFCNVQSQLSKNFKHRISHLLFYIFYTKFYACSNIHNSKKQIQHLTLCEYHSRSFKLKKVALIICMEIQQKYIKLNSFAQSRNYARKCLKLSVILNDRYSQFKVIEYLGVLNFYQGRMSQDKISYLSQKDRKIIIKNYSKEQQMPPIFNFLTQKSKEPNNMFSVKNREIEQIQNANNFIKNQVAKSNIKKFNRNYHAISKNIVNHTKVKDSIKKVNQVGTVKKYFGKDNFMTLHPQPNNLKDYNQNQVCVTHKKYAQIDKINNLMKKQVPQVKLLLLKLIAYDQLYES